jgi:hypothetical protein
MRTRARVGITLAYVPPHAKPPPKKKQKTSTLELENFHPSFLYAQDLEDVDQQMELPLEN